MPSDRKNPRRFREALQHIMTTPESTSLSDRRPARVFAARARWLRRWWAALLVAYLLVAPSMALAQAGINGTLVREYFVRQQAGQPLAIRITPLEAEFSVRVTGTDGVLLRQAELPGNRLQPLFVYIEGSSRERQLDIRVEAPWSTRRTRFDIEFYRLELRDPLSEKLAQAYRYLGYGFETLETETAANWSVQANMLLKAAQSFAEFGMEETRLWAVLSAAHLAHFRLGDTVTALDWVNQVLDAARLSSLPEAEFAAWVLRGEMRYQQAAWPGAKPDDINRALDALAISAQRARGRGDAYEEARALFLSGEAHAILAQHERALARYQAALDIALDDEAAALSAEVRKRMVTAHEALGDVVSTEQTLGSMVDSLTGGGAPDELVRGLLAQGQLYLDLYRYPDAESALRRSLEADSVSLTRTHAAILLGIALYEMGRFNEVAELLADTLVNPQSGLFRRPNPLLPLAEGLDALAGAYRSLGRFDDARRVRKIQSRHLEGEGALARWSAERVIDEVEAGDSAAAGAAWREGQAYFRGEGGATQADAARLALCTVAGSGTAGCEWSAVDEAYARLQEQHPRLALAAGAHRARYLARSGHAEAATQAYLRLLQQIHFFRSELKGVLGAWYWAQREGIFEAALEATGGESPAAALTGFSALVRILGINRTVSGVQGDDALRGEIASSGAGWAAEIDRRMKEFLASQWRFSESGVRAWLDALPRDAAVVAWLPGPLRLRTWVAGPRGVRQQVANLPTGAVSLLADLRNNPTAERQRRAGELFLGPIGQRLPETLYWLPVGDLLGAVPGDWLLGGQRLSERHDVIALLDFPVPPRDAEASFQAGFGRVFLAGDPVDWSAGVPERLSVSEEMAAVRSEFVGPGLRMVQGNALLADEFEGEQLAAADLVHLALPARIDLAQPENAVMELSEPGRGAGRQALLPADIRTWKLAAPLVVLGQSAMLNRVDSAFASRLGLVSDWLDAGADGVLVCHPNESSAAAGFLQVFYRELGKGRPVTAALRASGAGDGRAPSCQLYRQ